MEMTGRRYVRRSAYRTPRKPEKMPKEDMLNRFIIRLGICAILFIGVALYRNMGFDMQPISKALETSEAIQYTEVMSYIGQVITPAQTETDGAAITPDPVLPIKENTADSDVAAGSADNPVPSDTSDEPDVLPDNAVVDPSTAEPPVSSEQDMPTVSEQPAASSVDTRAGEAGQGVVFLSSESDSPDTTDPGPFSIPLPDSVVGKKVELGFKYTTPLYGTVTSPFAYRVHPLDGETKFHYGIDIAAAQGKAITAFAAGKVIEAGTHVAYGKYVKIEHTNGYITLYGHCSKLYVQKGDKVKMGQKIAAVGMTGWATGPHLHFEIRNAGKYYDPTYYLSL